MKIKDFKFNKHMYILEYTPIIIKNTKYFGITYLAHYLRYALENLFIYKNNNNTNVAPTGTFTSIWTSEDLIYASELGTQILHLEEGFHYDKTNNIFKAFVDFHYPIRVANKNNPKGKLTKLILNSLYGKTGQKLVNRVSMCVNEEQLLILSQLMENIRIHIELPTYKMYYISFDRSIDLNSITRIIKDNEVLQALIKAYNNTVKHQQYWSNSSLPHIAAFITAYARQDIHRLGLSVKHGIWNATDTDALHISFNLENPEHKAEFEYFLSLCGDNIGELKHVGTFSYVKFFAPKVYARYESTYYDIKNKLGPSFAKKFDYIYIQDKSESVKNWYSYETHTRHKPTKQIKYVIPFYRYISRDVITFHILQFLRYDLHSHKYPAHWHRPNSYHYSPKEYNNEMQKIGEYIRLRLQRNALFNIDNNYQIINNKYCLYKGKLIDVDYSL